MLKRTMTYTDFNGVERKEDYYFNYTKAEVLERQLMVNGGLTGFLQKIIDASEGPELVKFFKELILDAYGVKSDDGRQFIKNAEVKEAFKNTMAFSDLFMELSTDALSAANFVKGIMPADMVAEAGPQLAALEAKLASENK